MTSAGVRGSLVSMGGSVFCLIEAILQHFPHNTKVLFDKKFEQHLLSTNGWTENL